MSKNFKPIRHLISGAVSHLRTTANTSLRNLLRNSNTGVIVNEVATRVKPNQQKVGKWLTSKFAVPKYARFKLCIEYKTGRKPAYPSIDYTKKYINGKEYQLYSEENGFSKLLQSKMVQQTPYENYWRIVIYVNLTNDLRIDSHLYDHKVIEIEKGMISARYMLLRYFPDGKLDIQKTLLDTEIARYQGLIQTPYKK